MSSQGLNTSVIPVVLCGGSGTRLWPLSRKSLPKQFVPLIGTKSLLTMTLERVAELNQSDVAVVGSNEHRFLIGQSMMEAGVRGTILLEPVARNTAPAMAIAVLNATLFTAKESAADPLILFCPADHHIPDLDSFLRSVQCAIPAANDGFIVTFGARPHYPSTAYGYIRRGDPIDNKAFAILEFAEKPTAERARDLLVGRDVFWNCGIFLARASSWRDAFCTHAPDIWKAASDAMREALSEGVPDGNHFVRPNQTHFERCRSESVDYAVMERHPKVAVVPFESLWSDVGSWNAVADLVEPDENQNRLVGEGLAHQSKNTFLHAPYRPVVALGVDGLLIVDTPDAVLVANRQCAEAVKEVVTLLNSANIEQAHTHRRVGRPWGWYDTITQGDGFQVKRIGVRPKASLSLQMHHHRAEHWVVVRGKAEVTCGERTFILKENESTFIPLGVIHRLSNPGDEELEIIEVQSGGYLGEDDIVRFKDDYGRDK